MKRAVPHLARHSRSVAFVLSVGLLAIGAAASCKAKASPSYVESDAAVVVTDESRAYARSVFALRCAACHGAMGTGEKAAGVPVPNFRDATWQDGITDAAIERIIAEGGLRVGKNPIMPANPDLATSRESLAAMRAHIRAFGGR